MYSLNSLSLYSYPSRHSRVRTELTSWKTDKMIQRSLAINREPSGVARLWRQSWRLLNLIVAVWQSARDSLPKEPTHNSPHCSKNYLAIVFTNFPFWRGFDSFTCPREELSEQDKAQWNKFLVNYGHKRRDKIRGLL